MNASTDEQLAVTFQNSLRQADGAFWELHERHAPRLLAFLRNRSTSGGDSEDVHQEVWLRVWRHLPGRFRGDNFRAWLYEVARNCRIDWERKQHKARQATSFDDGQPLPADWNRPAPGQISKEQELAEQRKNAVGRCLRELENQDPNMAIIVRGRMRGRTYEEICQELHLRTEQAHKLFHQAKQHLRACAERAMT
jgi:RNA polymerase sigma factor (sigma-70 family)